MFASVRNAFQRNLVMGNKIDSVDVGKQIKTEPILDKAFIVSTLKYSMNILHVSLYLPAKTLLC